jgi:outer membrane protein assembly factor BamB
VTPPVIADGKVVFAPPDGDALYCLNLRDGSQVWKVDRGGDDLYLAGVYAGVAVIVGKRRVKAYTLAKGEKAWEVETGEPSGFGTAGNNIYYLPLRAGAASKAPEVCAIDVAKGKIVAHAEAREVNGKRDVPGNLVFVDGEVLSMSTSELVAFPLRKDGGKRQGTKESDKE